MRKNLYCFIVLFSFILLLSGCCQDMNEKNNQKNRYLMGKNYTFVYEIEKSVQEQILGLLNIKIPENEKDAYVFSFGYKKFSTNDNVSAFIIEIDGVDDYDSFFSYNKGRVKENGIDGLSLNEYNGLKYTDEESRLGISYYITYNDDFYDYNNEESEISKKLKEIFDNLQSRS